MSRVTILRHRLHRIAPAAITLGLALMLGQSGSAMAGSGINVDAIKQGLIGQNAAAAINFASLSPLPDGLPASGGNALSDIYIGDDMSFGAKHHSVTTNNWGSASQFYPPNLSSPGDAGILVRLGGVLYAPDFAAHGGSAAVTQLGTTTAWSGGSHTGPIGVTHTVVTTAFAGVLRLVMTTNYTDKSEFYSHDMTFTNTGGTAITFDAFLASDLYTSGSDAGIPVSGGGTTCANDRQIVHSSLPAANFVMAGGWATIWTAIKNGDIPPTITPSNCLDNGTALEWKGVVLAGGASTTILSKTTFGSSPAYVPSVTTWGIMLLTMLLASVGVLALRKRNNGSISA